MSTSDCGSVISGCDGVNGTSDGGSGDDACVSNESGHEREVTIDGGTARFNSGPMYGESSDGWQGCWANMQKMRQIKPKKKRKNEINRTRYCWLGIGRRIWYE